MKLDPHTLLDMFTTMLVNEVRAKLVVSDPDPWIKHTASPLGVRPTLKAIARGDLKAFKPPHSKVYLIRRSELDRHIQSHPAEQPSTQRDAGADAVLDEVLAPRGMRLAKPTERRTNRSAA